MQFVALNHSSLKIVSLVNTRVNKYFKYRTYEFSNNNPKAQRQKSICHLRFFIYLSIILKTKDDSMYPYYSCSSFSHLLHQVGKTAYPPIYLYP